MGITLKQPLLAAVGSFGAAVVGLFGGWDGALMTLLIFMSVDYISGLTVAGVFKRSNKTANGALESRAGMKGLCRKGMILFIVLIAARLDMLVNTTYIKDAVVIAFIANEGISILENGALMGIPINKRLQKALELLQQKEGENE